jgi:hypothetical protein
MKGSETIFMSKSRIAMNNSRNYFRIKAHYQSVCRAVKEKYNSFQNIIVIN